MYFSLFLFVFIALTFFAGWVTHIVNCIQNEAWILLVAGALMAPIGAIHGIGLWFGLF